MCHDSWAHRERRRDDRFDEELRYLLDERERSEAQAPVVQPAHDEEPSEQERPDVEVGARA